MFSWDPAIQQLASYPAIANPCREKGKETIHGPVFCVGASLAQPGKAR